MVPSAQACRAGPKPGGRGSCADGPGSVRRGRQACVRLAGGSVGAVERWSGRRRGTAGGGGAWRGRWWITSADNPAGTASRKDCSAGAGRKARAMVDRAAPAAGVWGRGQEAAPRRERESGRRRPGAGPGQVGAPQARAAARGGGRVLTHRVGTTLVVRHWGPAPNAARNGNQMSGHKTPNFPPYMWQPCSRDHRVSAPKGYNKVDRCARFAVHSQAEQVPVKPHPALPA